MSKAVQKLLAVLGVGLVVVLVGLHTWATGDLLSGGIMAAFVGAILFGLWRWSQPA